MSLTSNSYAQFLTTDLKHPTLDPLEKRKAKEREVDAKDEC